MSVIRGAFAGSKCNGRRERIKNRVLRAGIPPTADSIVIFTPDQGPGSVMIMGCSSSSLPEENGFLHLGLVHIGGERVKFVIS